MLKSLLCLLLSTLCVPAPARAGGDFTAYEELRGVIDQLEREKVYAPGELDALFAQVARDEGVLKAIARPAEGTKEWKDYRPLFLGADRVQRGVAFWQQYAGVLERAEKTYGVPAEMIVAIIGVETKYGGNKGRNRVVDALATLGFDYPPRAPFFRKELREFLVLAKENGLDPLGTYGSYAGAMGYPQFMPSSWRNLAVDFDGDGRRDLIDNPVDAIGSVANYFKANGWQTGQPVVARARIVNQDYDSILHKDLGTNSTLEQIAKKGLIPREPGTYLATTPASAIRLQGENGGEFWLGFTNFYVITKYNRSVLYAMAAFQLSQELKAAYALALQAPAEGTPAAPGATTPAAPESPAAAGPVPPA
ncbi:MAG TPA: lytic murein transglycosylase B [Moraxellaceae bacterium]|nr:lytic murein transglycosylase B [Moraxellaceae bacterium]